MKKTKLYCLLCILLAAAMLCACGGTGSKKSPSKRSPMSYDSFDKTVKKLGFALDDSDYDDGGKVWIYWPDNDDMEYNYSGTSYLMRILYGNMFLNYSEIKSGIFSDYSLDEILILEEGDNWFFLWADYEAYYVVDNIAIFFDFYDEPNEALIYHLLNAFGY